MSASSTSAWKLRPRQSALFIGVLVAAAGLFLWCTRGLTFLMDEWDLIQYRWPADADSYLVPHNQHLIVLQVIMFRAWTATFGLDDYLPYRFVMVAAHITTAALLSIVARRRLGAGVGAMVAMPVLFLGTAWLAVLFPFADLFVISAGCLLAIILVLDRRGSGSDIALAGLLTMCVASSEFGIAVALGVLVRLFLERRLLRRIWIVALPLGLYALWYATYGRYAQKPPGYHLSASPRFLLNVASSNVAAVFGIPLDAREIPTRPLISAAFHLLTISLGVALVVRFARTRRFSPPLAMSITILVVYWLTLTIGRGWTGSPYASHYRYDGAIAVLLVALEVSRELSLGLRARRAITVAAVLGTSFNIIALLHYAGLRRHDAAVVRAEIGALEIAQDRVAPAFRMNDEDTQAPSVRAGVYLLGTRELGSSPAPTEAQLRGLPSFARAHADDVLRRAVGFRLITATKAVDRFLSATASQGPSEIAVTGATGARPARRGRCVRLHASAGRAAVVELAFTSPGLRVHATGPRPALRLWRYANAADGASFPRTAATFYVWTPNDRSTTRWRIRMRTRGAIAIC